jgi:hypothetical protein
LIFDIIIIYFIDRFLAEFFKKRGFWEGLFFGISALGGKRGLGGKEGLKNY